MLMKEKLKVKNNLTDFCSAISKLLIKSTTDIIHIKIPGLSFRNWFIYQIWILFLIKFSFNNWKIF